jgi:ribosomal protein S18 acetylase RimI-like enzyme
MANVISPPAWFSQVQIRLLRKADLPALEWDGELTHFRRLYAEIYTNVCQGTALMWGAVLPTAGLIGQMFIQLKSSRSELADGVQSAYIYGFRIKVPYRGARLGTRMMEIAETDLLARRFNRVTLNVGQDNPAARRLYDRLGYQVIGSEAGEWFYLDEHGRRQQVHEPAWRMEKRLGDVKKK